MKPKAALVKDGFLPAGSENTRGRMSGAAIERCKVLASQGWDIEGFSVSQSTDSTEPVSVEKVKHDPNRIADVPDQARADADWTAWSTNGEVGMRTVCNTCGSSLTYCWCKYPTVWLDHENTGVVSFKPVR